MLTLHAKGQTLNIILVKLAPNRRRAHSPIARLFLLLLHINRGGRCHHLNFKDKIQRPMVNAMKMTIKLSDKWTSLSEKSTYLSEKTFQLDVIISTTQIILLILTKL